MTIEQAFPEDGALVAQVLHGRKDEFNHLVRRYFSMVYAVAYASLGNHEQAQDAVQETFLKAFTRLDSLREPAKFKQWLVSITRNVCHSLRRTETRHASSALDEAEAQAAVLPNIETRDLHRLIRGKLMALDEGPREVLLLHYFAGKPQKEIAELLGISPEAAQKRVSRAREVLGQQLVASIEDALGLEPAQREKSLQKTMGMVLALPAPWEAQAAGTTVAAAAGFGIKSLITVVLAVCAVIAGMFVLPVFNSPALTPSPADSPVSQPAATQNAEATGANLAAGPESASAVLAALASSPWEHEPANITGDLVVRGQVVDSRGQPAAKALVQLTQVGYEGTDPVQRLVHRRQITTDGQGWFAFDGLPISGDQDSESDFFLHATLDGLGAVLNVREYTAFRSERLWLTPAGTLAGRVVDANGGPVAGARVYPTKWSGEKRFQLEYKHGLSVTTDTEGLFRMEGMPAGAWSLAAVGEGLSTAIAEDVTIGAEDIVLTLPDAGDAAAIEGRVKQADTGTPLAGVYVVLDYAPTRWLARTWTQTDGKGRFRFEGLAAGKYTVDLEDMAWALTEQGAAVELASGETHDDIVFETVPTASAAGRVYEKGSGQGIAGVVVMASPASSEGFAQYASDQVVRRTYTDDTGAYRIDGLRPLVYRVRVGRIAGHPLKTTMTTQAEDTPLQPGQELAVDFVVERGIRVAGRVVDEHGVGVGGARIWCSGSTVQGIDRTYSESDGSFAISHVEGPMRDLNLFAQKPGLAMKPHPLIEVPGAGVSGVELEMVVAAQVLVTVRNAHGAPVGGAGVMPIGPHEYNAYDNNGFADEQGRFFLDGLYPGTYQFAVTPPDSMRTGGSDRQGPFEIVAGPTIQDIPLVFNTETNLTISGTVKDTTGEALIADMYAYGPSEVHGDSYSPVLGRFTLRGLAPGSYTVTAWHAGRTIEIENVAAGTDNVAFVFPPAAKVTGRVLDAKTQAIVPDFELGYSSNDARTGEEMFSRQPSPRNSADGSFSLDNLAPGDVTLTVLAEGYRPVYYPAAALEPGETREVVVTLELGGVLQGRVVDPQGQPVAGAKVALRSPENLVPRIDTSADETGRFEFTSYTPELTEIAAADANFATTTLPLTPAMAAREVVIQMQQGAAIDGYLSLNGVALTGRYIGTDAGPGVSSDDTGKYRLEHLPPGTRIVTAYFWRPGEPDMSPAKIVAPVELADNETRELNIAGETGPATLVVMRDENSDPALINVNVWQFNSAGQTQFAESNFTTFDDTGAATFEGLLPGPATVQFYPRGSTEPAASIETELRAGEVVTVTAP